MLLLLVLTPLDHSVGATAATNGSTASAARSGDWASRQVPAGRVRALPSDDSPDQHHSSAAVLVRRTQLRPSGGTGRYPHVQGKGTPRKLKRTRPRPSKHEAGRTTEFGRRGRDRPDCCLGWVYEAARMSPEFRPSRERAVPHVRPGRSDSAGPAVPSRCVRLDAVA